MRKRNSGEHLDYQDDSSMRKMIGACCYWVQCMVGVVMGVVTKVPGLQHREDWSLAVYDAIEELVRVLV
jgi:hypothetical protein